ncbi:hypothetical protein GCM10009814_22550 [Lapillicoccus jejuensis]|uniref:Uncharacterized protein n=1 Tax=Lapillicoccus jejuensis TaxID=402171 RepID=A0A542DWZ2_9MICO|nr:hypothetical protein FB458_0687 [Lapillicoccus jejuensis]
MALAGLLLGVLVPVASAATSVDLIGPYTGLTARAWGAVSPAPRQTTRAVDGRDGPVTVTGARTRPRGSGGR